MTKTWQEELEDISSDIDDEDLPNWYPVISFPDALKFITDIRKHDEEELIKKFYDDTSYSSRLIKVFIKKHYESK